MTDWSTLWLLFSASFVSATLLPLGSEAALSYFVNQDPDAFTVLILIATLGNTLGGMSNYVLARLLPNKMQGMSKAEKAMRYLTKYGYPALLFSWLPIIGDPLCFMAGWMRLNPLRCLVLIALGKFARYLVLGTMVLQLN